MEDEIEDLLTKIKGKKKPEELVTVFKEELNGRSFRDQLNILGSLIFYYSETNLAKENVQALLTIDEFIYKLLKFVYPPKEALVHLGLIGQVLLKEHPVLAKLLFPEKERQDTSII